MKKLLFLTLILIISINASDAFTDINKLQTTAPSTYSRLLKLAQDNVDNAVRSEGSELTRWFNRHNRVQRSIDLQNADIVCLEELRELDDRLPVKQFLAKLSKYNHVFNKRNPSKFAFGQAILYDPNKLFLLDSFSRWLSDTPNEVSDFTEGGFGSMVLCAKFQHVENGKIIQNMQPLWVFNVHFPLGEEEKTKCCYKLLEIINELAGNEPYVVLGDFNTFPDRDGFKQRAILSAKMQNLTDHLFTESGMKVSGTFVGTDLDQFKSKFPLEENMAQLDYIYTSKDLERADDHATVIARTMLEEEPQELSTRNFPSDHLPVVARIRVGINPDAKLAALELIQCHTKLKSVSQEIDSIMSEFEKGDISNGARLAQLRREFEEASRRLDYLNLKTRKN